MYFIHIDMLLIGFGIVMKLFLWSWDFNMVLKRKLFLQSHTILVPPLPGNIEMFWPILNLGDEYLEISRNWVNREERRKNHEIC